MVNALLGSVCRVSHKSDRTFDSSSGYLVSTSVTDTAQGTAPQPPFAAGLRVLGFMNWYLRKMLDIALYLVFGICVVAFILILMSVVFGYE